MSLFSWSRNLMISSFLLGSDHEGPFPAPEFGDQAELSSEQGGFGFRNMERTNCREVKLSVHQTFMYSLGQGSIIGGETEKAWVLDLVVHWTALWLWPGRWNYLHPSASLWKCTDCWDTDSSHDGESFYEFAKCWMFPGDNNILLPFMECPQCARCLAGHFVSLIASDLQGSRSSLFRDEGSEAWRVDGRA